MMSSACNKVTLACYAIHSVLNSNLHEPRASNLIIDMQVCQLTAKICTDEATGEMVCTEFDLTETNSPSKFTVT